MGVLPELGPVGMPGAGRTRAQDFRGLLAGTAIGLASLSVAGCSGKAAPCLPPDAAVWTERTSSSPQSTGASVDVYVDGSGSMVGFIRGATATDRPLEDIIARLPWIAGAAGGASGTTAYNVFGRTIHTLPQGQEARLATETPYTCKGISRDSCDNDQTRLDLVFNRVKSKPADHLAVVITDLWLSGSDIPGGPAVLAAPLSSMLSAGRSLGVVGIKAPYRGLIYDIPNAPPYAGATSHPLFIILLGPLGRVQDFHDRLTKEGVIRGDADWSLFTLSPLLPPNAAGSSLKVTEGPALHERPALPPSRDISLQQFQLSRTAALRAAATGQSTAGRATFSPNLDSSARAGAVWRGPLSPHTSLWRLKSASAVCHANAWTPVGSYSGGWSSADAGGGIKFVLDPQEAASQLPAGKIYLIAGAVSRSGLENPNRADAWMRAWSFNASTAPALLGSKPQFFPTLNLADTASLLEQALDQAASSHKGEISGFAVLVKSNQ